MEISLAYLCQCTRREAGPFQAICLSKRYIFCLGLNFYDMRWGLLATNNTLLSLFMVWKFCLLFFNTFFATDLQIVTPALTTSFHTIIGPCMVSCTVVVNNQQGGNKRLNDDQSIWERRSLHIVVTTSQFIMTVSQAHILYDKMDVQYICYGYRLSIR